MVGLWTLVFVLAHRAMIDWSTKNLCPSGWVVEEAIYLTAQQAGDWQRLHVIRYGNTMHWRWQDGLSAPVERVCVMVARAEGSWPRMVIDARTGGYVESGGETDDQAASGPVLTQQAFDAWFERGTAGATPANGDQKKIGYRLVESARRSKLIEDVEPEPVSDWVAGEDISGAGMPFESAMRFTSSTTNGPQEVGKRYVPLAVGGGWLVGAIVLWRVARRRVRTAAFQQVSGTG